MRDWSIVAQVSDPPAAQHDWRHAVNDTSKTAKNMNGTRHCCYTSQCYFI